MPKKKSLLLIIILISAWIPFNSFAVELKTAAQKSAPKYYKSDTNQIVGLCVDIIHAIESVDQNIKFTGYQEFTSFKRLQHQLESGQLDIFLGMKQTAKRKDQYNFLNIPLYQLNYVIAVRKDDNIHIQNFDDIRAFNENGEILTVRGSAASTFLQKQGGLLVYDGANSPSTLLKMLKYKRARFAFYHDLGLHYINNKEGFANEIKIFPVSFLTYSHYVAFSRNVSDETIDKIKIALEKLKSSGELKKIYRKYSIQK